MHCMCFLSSTKHKTILKRSPKALPLPVSFATKTQHDYPCMVVSCCLSLGGRHKGGLLHFFVYIYILGLP